MAEQVHLALLWHQHQPFYKDLKTGKAIMPWARLHATKDYYDMAAVLDRFPKIRMTVNLVPSLVQQLEDIAGGGCVDPWLEKTLVPAERLETWEKRWILENFFHSHTEHMILPNPRYAELFEKRGQSASPEEIERALAIFTAQDFLDLQCWFNLAWMGPTWHHSDSTIGQLYKKGKGFVEGEKRLLVEKQREICRLVISKHRELWHRSQIEVSTTPFYHPILPLLCDTDTAQISMPGSSKPRERFRHPEDAKIQIQMSLEYMERIFGKRPQGMWPSEGSVSAEAATLMEEAGIRWTATDEGILFRSLKLESGIDPDRQSLYQPYRFGGNLQIFFRDLHLSDAIGFSYGGMNAKAAVNDFISKVLKIADSIPHKESPPVVSVILDGENCWEHYKNDGADFLNELYTTLSENPRIQTTTFSDFLDKHPAQKSLKNLWPGSWIGSDFRIWIGQDEDNRAWDLVSETRGFLENTGNTVPGTEQNEALRLAWESLYIAEGSDWFWWYGDQNPSVHAMAFDELFRTHLKNVYIFLGKEPPAHLNDPIKRPLETVTRTVTYRPGIFES